jgi:hypothetical protein
VGKQFETAVQAYFKGEPIQAKIDLEVFRLSDKLEPNHNRNLENEWPTKDIRAKWGEADAKQSKDLEIIGVLFSPNGYRWDFILSNGE